jgi:hypothetical protein
MFQTISVPASAVNRWILSGLEVAQIPLNQDSMNLDVGVSPFPVAQFLVSLAVGLVIAFALQVLFTNLSVALGISILGDDNSDHDDSGNLGDTIRSIETKVGLWAVLTVSIALFTACFLAVKLSGVNTSFLGMIIGVVVWAIFFLSLVWVSSTTIGALIGSIAKTAMSGFQGIMGIASTAVGGNIAKKQAVSTAEEIVASVRQELTAGIDPSAIRSKLQDSLNTLQLPKIDFSQVRSQLEAILSKSDLNSIPDLEALRSVDRQTFADLIGENTKLSKRESKQIVDQLEEIWHQVIEKRAKGNPQTALLEFFGSATKDELRSNKLADRLKQAIAVYQDHESSSDRPLLNQALDLGTKTLIPLILSRVDLSDLDVERVIDQLQKLTANATGQASQLAGRLASTAPPASPSRIDLDNYLLNAYLWHFNQETMQQDLTQILYDPEADPVRVRQQLEQLNLRYFTQKLSERGDLLPSLAAEIAQRAEAIRLEVLERVQAAEAQELCQRLEDRLQFAEIGLLDSESLKQDLKALLADAGASDEAIQQRLQRLDLESISQRLQQRQNLTFDQTEAIDRQLEASRQQVLTELQEQSSQAQFKATQLREKIEAYLRSTNKAELNPEAIERDFKVLLDDPQVGLSRLRGRLSEFDRDTLVKLLSQREDLSEAEVNQVLDQLEAVRDRVLQAPALVATKAKQQYEKTTDQVAQYLRNTNLQELDPEGIQQDLRTLLADPKAGTFALRDRLSQVDRETLVKLLSQREDLTEEQVNHAVDQVEEAIRRLVKAPRRLASRVQTQVQDFGTSLEGYLRNTDKTELNPEGIKRDLQLLLQDPRLGAGNLRDRLSHFDRSTLVALLAQREDISPEEAEHIVGQIESVRDSLLEQARRVQHQVQAIIQGIFDSIRNYLDSLERPELNYEGIQHDFSLLFDDPQAGFDALRSRLGQINRDTLIAVLSSRDDISKADADRIIAQVEAARDGVLQRADRIQQEVQTRLAAIKQQARKQALGTKRAVASAAWWLFGTAFTSLIASAIAGVLAVSAVATVP